ncbi:MAG: AzlD domain-containing protein [Proteobacteria bacterium]|nr:AzlD domain-containing protein [Pseudomonadota bacterium]
MMSSSDFLALLAVMAIAAYTCRVLGFMAMRYVPMTARMQAALKATPISVMSGIVALTAYNGGPPEWVALGVVIGLMRIFGNDIIAAFGGIAAVALMRATGF